MTNAVLLDNVAHKDLKVRTGHSAEFGDNVNLAMIFPTELALAQREYPIVIRRDDEGALQPYALLGLDKGENLFLDGNDWNARYVPAVQQRGPFLIGLHGDAVRGNGRPEPMIHVDLDHPRVSSSEGEPVFLPHGGNSPYLEHASRVLQMIYQGAELTQPMFAAFEEEGLIEAMDMEINLDERTKYTLPDFFTVNQEKLASLKSGSLERLNRLGYLQAAFFIAHSLGNIEWLIHLKNRKRAVAPA